MASTKLRKVAVYALALTALGGTVALSAPRTALVSSGLDSRLVRILETRFAPAVVADWSQVKGLIVAGGSTLRAEEALRLATLHPHLQIVLSGPSDAEIALVRRSASVGPERIYIDRQPQNTYENALKSKALVAPQAGERWLLVTSASHMPRAFGAFHAVGFHVDAWPVSDTTPDSVTHVAAHEWLGLLVYWARGRSIALLPGDADAAGEQARAWRRGLTHRG